MFFLFVVLFYCSVWLVLFSISKQFFQIMYVGAVRVGIGAGLILVLALGQMNICVDKFLRALP